MAIFRSTIGKILIGLAILLVTSLQYAYWFGESGYYQHQQLKQELEVQAEANRDLQERNRILAAEVYDLKNGLEAVEEYARLDLGLIKPHETFVQMSMITGAYKPIYIDNNNQNPTNSTSEDEDSTP